MTHSGTFVVSGCERVIINQLIRSAGAYYKREITEEKDYVYRAVVISNRGSWIQFELDTENTVWIRLSKTYIFNVYHLKMFSNLMSQSLEDHKKYFKILSFF